MTHRLILGALASLAALFMVVGRTQSLSAATVRPVQAPTLDRLAPTDADGIATSAMPDLGWLSQTSSRLLEVVYVYSHRAPAAARGASAPGRRDRSEG